MFFQRMQKSLLLSVICGFQMNTWAQTVTLPVINFPPYIMISESDNSISGMDIRVVKAAFKAVGIQTIFEKKPWQSIVQNLQEGNVLGTVTCSRRPERAPFMFFSDELSTTSRAVISRVELDTHGIESVYDLADYQTISVEGWDMEQQLLSLNIPHQLAQNIAQGLNSVVSGEADLFYVSDYPALYQARILGIHKRLKVTNIVSEPLVPLHVCFSKHYPESRERLQEFNKGLQIIKRNGTYQAIRDEYL
ncbi:transporter substrate-binding domain-containing protein [Marinomonas atlantica]|uniref:transporter substrate-binding domain-containing protein n=1 Tax=Marinomonas atlantica TaxID=1806668 RepID=UPI0018D3318B|nr:transporter substrate-binding domain-containing protein [Marinomonas atlantica]MCO4785622.1 transporter substrate-binding domain-containing protein [Marinomonas atlantica]